MRPRFGFSPHRRSAAHRKNHHYSPRQCRLTASNQRKALGYVTNVLSEEELYSRSRKQLLASIDVAMGGRAAEEVFFG